MPLQPPDVAAAGLGISMAVGYLMLPLLRRHALDMPNVRSSHADPTPRGGGVAVVLATIAAAAAGGSESGVRVLCTSFAAIAALGLIDDLRGLGEVTRFGVQVLLSAGTAVLLLEGQLGLPAIGMAVAIGAAAIWLVAFVNAFNFMDGINGISAMSAAVAAGWYWWLGTGVEIDGVVILAAAVFGASVGFLPLNFPKAQVFLGDVGSYGVGMVLGSLGLMTLMGGASFLQSVAPLVIYLSDTGWTLLRRMARGERWWKAHRENVYQRLAESATSRLVVAVVVPSLSVLLCLVTVVVASEAVQVAMGACVILLYLSLPRLRMLRSS